jgi:CheY-like chemotaxis protein
MSKELVRAVVRSKNNLPQRILVVDDDHIVRQANLALLASAGYDVDGAKDGAEGWDALQVKHYDLVLTDNSMPRMTGIELIEKLRSSPQTVPVIMATGFLPIFELNRKPWLQPDAAMTVPFSNEDLLATIAKILKPREW